MAAMAARNSGRKGARAPVPSNASTSTSALARRAAAKGLHLPASGATIIGRAFRITLQQQMSTAAVYAPSSPAARA